MRPLRQHLRLLPPQPLPLPQPLPPLLPHPLVTLRPPHQLPQLLQP